MTAQIEHDGYRITVFTSLYVDYGLCLERFDPEEEEYEEVFYSPCCLSIDSYGRKPSADYDSYDDADDAESMGVADAFEAWTVDDWIEALRSEADTFIEAYGPYGH
jgi:hypothetical protein